MQVLRFYALWDHTDSLYGEARPVTIQYYLVDDSVEIREVHEHNSGRDPFPVLLRRQRLPKTTKPTCGKTLQCNFMFQRKNINRCNLLHVN